MLKKAYRLASSLRIRQVRAEGQSWVNRWAVLIKAPSEMPVPRFAFVVSKRIGHAVRRNRVKRLFREAVRKRITQVPSGWDVLLIARGPTRDATMAQIDRAVADLLRRSALDISDSVE